MLEAIAVAADDTNSAVASADLTSYPRKQRRPAPTFSPVAGTYSSAQSVTLSDATSGRNHLLPTQRKYAHHILDQVHPAPCTVEHDGDAGGNRCSAGRHQQWRWRLLPTPYLAKQRRPRRLSPRCRDYIPPAQSPVTIFRCHLGRNHLLHNQRKYADHILDQVHRHPSTVSTTEMLEAIAVAAGDTNSAG